MSSELRKLDQQLVDSNLRALAEGAELIHLLKDDQYIKGYTPAFQSTIGAHFRHVLEHYQCFSEQLSQGVFCYDNRARDQRLECDSAYALTVIDELMDSLQELKQYASDAELYFEDETTAQPVLTSLNRELLFLQSHTVHHYAIIGAMTRAFGNQPKDNFGVAIATQLHNERCADQASRVLKGAACAR